MSQYDFGTIDPNTKSGTALATDLNSWRNALHSTHGGSTAPSYITAGMLWLDTTSANYKLKLYDGAQSIDVGIIDATNNVARVAVDSAATSYITATTAAQIKFVIASVDTATVRSTGLQFNIAAPYIGDSSNNELVSFTTTASAVNQVNIANAATATNPVISAVGNDTNIGITLTPKGTGRTNIGQLALDGTTITTTAAQLNFVTGVTSAVQTQLDAKAPLASPALTGTPTAPTASVGTNTTQIATTAFVAASQAAGEVSFFAMSSAPTGWLKANGAAVSRTTYAALFAAIGTTFGAGDGSTTFNVPELRGEFIRALADGRAVDTGRALGSAQAEDLLAHSHGFRAYGGSGAVLPNISLNGSLGTVVGTTALNTAVQNSSGVETRPRNVALLACIRY
jgi:microcystin-dependent protein